jgi:tetratricopeptide (TPR) repeat protein
MNYGARALPAAVATQLVSLFEAGKWAELERAAGTVTQRYPRHILGWRALGKAKLALGKPQDAIDVLSRAVTVAPGEADVHNDLGSAFSGRAQRAEAEASFRRAIDLNPRSPEPHINLGALLCGAGQYDDAIACYQRALAIDPRSAVAFNNLGNLLREVGRLAEAEASYRQALALKPGYPDAVINLGSTLGELTRFDEAITCYRQALRMNPNSVPALTALGRTLVKLATDDAEAIGCLRRALALAPGDAALHVDLGNVLMRQHRQEEALDLFCRGQVLQPLLTWPAIGGAPAFSAVFLDTPMGGSTPVDYLAGKANYDRHFFCLMPGGGQYDDLLRARADVIFNMICNVDDGAEVLGLALDLVDRLGCPVVNHPRLIMNTDRATVARRIAAEVPQARMPRTVRLPGATLAAAASAGGCEGLALPLLVRFAGTHGGDDFYKFDDWPAIAAHAALTPERLFYVTEYADYQSPDGFFRKYRVIFIDGEILPYHLAIHDDWKVHHFRTDMANHLWMRDEEAAFLDDMNGVFSPLHRDALRAIGRAVELDYCGIDCSLDRAGRLVVFECNASMLVHDEKTEIYAYKNQAVRRIKGAFDALLDRRRLRLG